MFPEFPPQRGNLFGVRSGTVSGFRFSRTVNDILLHSQLHRPETVRSVLQRGLSAVRRGLRLSGSQVAAEVMPDRVPADRQIFNQHFQELLPGELFS